ncbi:MAG: hypothetical protein IJL90_01725 [Lachnospiraceae bacterium]|nr:hypothetical protein [Lachnospiraceae bacterium]
MFNSPDEVNLRRYTDNLAGSGAAVILFGIWSAVRLFMQITMDRTSYEDIIEAAGITDYTPEFLNLVIFFILLFSALIIMLLHLCVGVAAIRYSRGRSVRRTYLLFVAVVMIFMFVGIRGNFFDAKTDQYVFKMTALATSIVDITLVFVLFDIIFSSIMIGKLRKNVGPGLRSI